MGYALCSKVGYREQGEKEEKAKGRTGYHKKTPNTLSAKGTAACQGPYQKLQVCALALVWAALVSNVVRKGFRFFALLQSQCEMVYLNLITEEGIERDGTSQGGCPGMVDDLQPPSPMPDVGATCVGISIWRSLLQTVAFVSSIVHQCPY